MVVLGSDNKLKNKLHQRMGERCLFDEELKYHTSYQIGGYAQMMLFPATVQEWRFVFNFCQFNQIPLTILGAGTNVLVSDDGIEGVTASTDLLEEITINGNIVTARAGVTLDDLIKTCIENGLQGMEKMSGIPGSAGGAIFMNAGAFGQETFDNLLDFQTLDYSGYVNTLSKNDVKHCHRKVEGIKDLLIFSARWQLEKGNIAELKKIRNETLDKRAQSQPLDYPSAGSVFKRPANDYASRLIDEAGLKGLKVGNAQVCEKHAGFIVNLGNAKAKDVCKLIDIVRSKVKNKTGINLEMEQKLLGKF
ncbi:MAG TPA: UDP-N-acetylmuramate dehydrogenase [Elusimicrobiales bacterium]|nr:UDP-N-acetylmuramate dehydrogenase [Elusimicrobiales bacterium]